MKYLRSISATPEGADCDFVDANECGYIKNAEGGQTWERSMLITNSPGISYFQFVLNHSSEQSLF
jgi:hypothetical protein